jgi:hypothetical protein
MATQSILSILPTISLKIALSDKRKLDFLQDGLGEEWCEIKLAKLKDEFEKALAM